MLVDLHGAVAGAALAAASLDRLREASMAARKASALPALGLPYDRAAHSYSKTTSA